MFGSYEIPVKIEDENFSLSIQKENDIYIYRRESLYGKEEKVLLIDNGRILLNPIEPLNRPKDITSYLLIEFERPFVVSPGKTITVFIKFPVEIGIFISENKNYEILDVVTLVNQKFTLYGDPGSGIICKYWRSGVYSSIPEVDHKREGIIKINVKNTTSRWIEVTKTVFNAYDMKIFYNNELVAMKAKMKILGEQIAETVVIDSSPLIDMKKSIELYNTRKVSVIGPRFVMEGGL